jgi:SAM-dependent methyltransferase
MKQPQVWHHGLVAREWAEFATDGGREAKYFKNLIEISGEPALDLGCGTGRVLLPLLQAGLDVDGCDFSKDMVAQCEARAKKAGSTAPLPDDIRLRGDWSRRRAAAYPTRDEALL